MAATRDPPEWFTEQPGLTALALVSVFLALLVIVPYLQYVLFGVVLAYIAHPVQQRMERYVRPTIAALVVVVLTVVVLLLPLVYLLTVAFRQGVLVVEWIRDEQINVETIEQLLESNGYAVDLVELYEANQDRIASAIQQLTDGAIDLAGGLPNMFIGLTITTFVLFGLLRDGGRFVAWIQWVIPVDDEILADLQEGIDELMWASVIGNVAVAVIQAVMLGVGLWVAGVPAVIFLTVATFVLTLLPLIGAFGVWIPAAIYLLATGSTTAGLAMVVYGLFVTLSDSYYRPAIIGQTGGYNALIVIVGIFGGLVAFGAVGLFLGPVVLGATKLVLDSFARVRTGTEPPGAVGDDAEGPKPGSGATPSDDSAGDEPVDGTDPDSQESTDRTG
ncbi:putative permease [Halovivax ruber XH-70]|uniref:Putative permease n=1 Tax=Halovivax ruber (strain DSM 18193 / JCM 13892 / XH-70) TaxID=797302 RepID=L0IC23_HALRX|nr:AI-2E family transporter [Halovivax ruber]AGB16289.1 putative permease [Halovivax ruber XH-70]